MQIGVKDILKKHNINPSKSLGQNFLINGEILRNIVNCAGLEKNDLVLEIGPGLGSLTAELAQKAGWVVAVEIDKRLIAILNENLSGYSNISVINGDILKIDIKKELETVSSIQCGFKPSALKVVANLPYYITTPVVMTLLEKNIGAETMVFMVQKEVAERMKAPPGGKDYGALSVAVQYYSKPSIVMDVPPHCFIPQPDVYSSVVRLDIFKEPPVKVNDKELFFNVVKAAFGQRRKTLVNALANASYIDADKEQIKKILLSIGIDENQRGETLSVSQFAQLSNLLANK